MSMATFGILGLSGGTTGTPTTSKMLLVSKLMTTEPVAPEILTPPALLKTTKSPLLTSSGPKVKGPVEEAVLDVAILHT
jgi:hypothetical protein